MSYFVDGSKPESFGTLMETFYLHQNFERVPIDFNILLSFLQIWSLIASSKIKSRFELRIHYFRSTINFSFSPIFVGDVWNFSLTISTNAYFPLFFHYSNCYFENFSCKFLGTPVTIMLVALKICSLISEILSNPDINSLKVFFNISAVLFISL